MKAFNGLIFGVALDNNQQSHFDIDGSCFESKNAKVIRAFLLVDLIYIQSFFQAHGPP